MKRNESPDLKSSTERFLNSFNGKNHDVMEYEGEKIVNKMTKNKDDYSNESRISDVKIKSIKRGKK